MVLKPAHPKASPLRANWSKQQALASKGRTMLDHRNDDDVPPIEAAFSGQEEKKTEKAENQCQM